MLMILHDLDVEVPLRVVAPLDRVVKVLGGRTEVLALDLGSLLFGEAGDPLPGMPVVLDQHGPALGVHHLVGVDPEALHVAIGRRDPPGAEQVGEHVHGLR